MHVLLNHLWNNLLLYKKHECCKFSFSSGKPRRYRCRSTLRRNSSQLVTCATLHLQKPNSTSEKCESIPFAERKRWRCRFSNIWLFPKYALVFLLPNSPISFSPKLFSVSLPRYRCSSPERVNWRGAPAPVPRARQLAQPLDTSPVFRECYRQPRSMGWQAQHFGKKAHNSSLRAQQRSQWSSLHILGTQRQSGGTVSPSTWKILRVSNAHMWIQAVKNCGRTAKRRKTGEQENALSFWSSSQHAWVQQLM